MVSSCFFVKCSPWTLVWRVPSWLMLCITQLPPWTKVCYIIIPHLDQTNGLVHPRVADITRWLTLTSPGLGPSQIYRALCGDAPVFWFFCEEILLLGRGCYSYIEDLEKKQHVILYLFLEVMRWSCCFFSVCVSNYGLHKDMLPVCFF